MKLRRLKHRQAELGRLGRPWKMHHRNGAWIKVYRSRIDFWEHS